MEDKGGWVRGGRGSVGDGRVRDWVDVRRAYWWRNCAMTSNPSVHEQDTNHLEPFYFALSNTEHESQGENRLWDRYILPLSYHDW